MSPQITRARGCPTHAPSLVARTCSFLARVTLSFRLLGPFEVAAGEDLLPLGGPKQRRLLAVLALAVGRPVPVDALVEAVWDDDAPSSALATVQAYVSRLRGTLAARCGRPPGEVVRAGAGGYALADDDVDVDVVRFEALTTAGLRALREHDPRGAVPPLREAAALWRGPLLADLQLSGRLADERKRWAVRREASLDALYDAELACGRAADVLAELQQRVAAAPVRELPYQHLIVALDRCGRQADALTAYAEVRRVLRDELGVEPGRELRRLHQQLLSRASSDDGRRGRVPVPRNPLVGREHDVAAVDRGLRRSRLVTVTGPAGAGKTRLAVEVARSWEEELPDGAAMVELAPARDSADVARAVARALGVLEQPERDLATSVGQALSGQSLLLVLDNCEHVTDACADLVTALTRGAPGVRVLATSQEPLRVDEELVHRLTPLAVPAEGAAVDAVRCAPAVELFAARARQAQPGFAVCAANRDAVARVCRELDGLPLALELAAATLRAVDVADVAARLPDRFALLSRGPRSGPARHRSLEAAVTWGYDLLTPAERDFFVQLSVFAGGFTLDTAEQVCRVDGADGSAPALLTGLVDKSFVQADPGHGRYALLETLRLHGTLELERAGGADEVRARHARAVLALCGAAAPELRGPSQLATVLRLDAERDNVAAALRWAIDRGDAEVGLGIVATIWWYWWRNGHIPEGAQWAGAVLDRFRGPSPLRAAALVGASHLWWKLGRFDTAEGACDEALDLLAHEPATPLSSAARGVLAMVVRDRGDLPAAASRLHEVLGEYVAAGELWGEAATLNMLVSVDRDSADLDVAAARLRRSTELFDALGDQWGQAWSAWLSGRVATRRGDLDVAAERLHTSLVLASELRHGFGVVLGLAGLAGVAAARGDHVVAARLLGATDALEHAMGFPVRAIEKEDSAHDVAVTSRALGPDAYREHWSQGTRLTPEAAAAEGLVAGAPG